MSSLGVLEPFLSEQFTGEHKSAKSVRTSVGVANKEHLKGGNVEEERKRYEVVRIADGQFLALPAYAA